MSSLATDVTGVDLHLFLAYIGDSLCLFAVQKSVEKSTVVIGRSGFFGARHITDTVSTV